MKIHSLTLQNFKAFKDREQFVFEGKNILAYGANGSGKSSLFKAMRYLFNSSVQDEADVRNYFDRTHPETVKNIFAAADAQSFVKITTRATIGAGNTTSNEYIFSDKKRPNVREMQDALLLSDFINYRLLFNFSQFGDYEDANIYEAIKREFFPIWYDTEGQAPQERLDSSKMLAYIPLPETGTLRSLAAWHNHLEDELKYLRGKQYKADSSGRVYNMHPKAPPYKHLLAKFELFNAKLEALLNDITRTSNTYLKTFLRMPGIELRFEYRTPLGPDTDNVRHWDLNSPVIRLVLRVQGEIIQRPHTFLNEARLTALAFSIRMAAFSQRLQQDKGLKVLVLDDILMSMDMSNRFQFFQFILTHPLLSDHQKIILTHERDLYDQIWAMVQSYSELNDKDWKRFELYESTIDSQGRYHNPTLIIDSKNDREKADAYFNLKDYPTSSIYYRKAIEGKLKHLLEGTGYALEERAGVARHVTTLEPLRKAALDLFRDKSLDATPLENLGILRLVLNHAAHDNVRSALFRHELLTIQQVLEELDGVRKLTVIKKYQPLNITYLHAATQKVAASIGVELEDPLMAYVQGPARHPHLRNNQELAASFITTAGKLTFLNINDNAIAPILNLHYQEGQDIDVTSFEKTDSQGLSDYKVEFHNNRGQSLIDNIKQQFARSMR